MKRDVMVELEAMLERESLRVRDELEVLELQRCYAAERINTIGMVLAWIEREKKEPEPEEKE